MVLSDGFDAPRGTLYRFERRQSSSSLVRVGSPLPVWLGRSGLGWRSDPGAPIPPVEGPVKREGDGRSPAGILPIGEMFTLDALAAACAADGRYEVFLTSAPLNKLGGVASPPNALALR